MIELDGIKADLKKVFEDISLDDSTVHKIRQDFNISQYRLVEFCSKDFWQNLSKDSKIELTQLEMIIKKIRPQKTSQFEEMRLHLVKSKPDKKNKVSNRALPLKRSLFLGLVTFGFFVFVYQNDLSRSLPTSSSEGVKGFDLNEYRKEYLGYHSMGLAHQLGDGSSYIEILATKTDKLYYSQQGKDKQAVLILKGLTRLFFDGKLTLFVNSPSEYKFVYHSVVYKNLSFNKNRSIIVFN